MQDKSQARKGAGVANVVRQTWDRAHYDKLAKLRADGQVEHEEVRFCVHRHCVSNHELLLVCSCYTRYVLSRLIPL